MSNIKLSVTIELPGSTMMSPQECGENPENYNRVRILLSVKHWDKKTKKAFYKVEPLEFKTRKCVPAQQSINMTDEAYEYMTSQACPEWYYLGVGKWKKLSKIERLEQHLERTCKALKGISYTYVVFGE